MCCSSWAAAVHVIAAVDLFTSAFQVTFETARFGLITGVLVPMNGTSKTHGCTSNCTWLYQIVGDGVHFNFDTLTVSLLILSILVGFMIEGFLFSSIRKGVMDNTYKHCHRWLYWRIVLLLVTASASIIRFVLGDYLVSLDGLTDVLKIYRVISLIIVKLFMVELAYTVGKNYFSVPETYK